MTWDSERDRLWRVAHYAIYRGNTAGEPESISRILAIVAGWLRGLKVPPDVDLYVHGLAMIWDKLPQEARDYLKFCATDGTAQHTVADLLALRGQSDDHD